MFSIPKRFHLIFLIEVILCIGAIAVLAWYFDLQEARLVALLDERVGAERAQLLATLSFVDRGSAGSGDAVIADCTSRNQFEDLLGRLHTLSRVDLERASALFEACGDYFATRKSIGVLLLKEDFEALREAIDARHRMASDDPYVELLDTWKRIVDLEEKRAALLREQVVLQRDIIAELLVQGSAGVVQERMARAGQVMELFAVHDKQIDTLRAEEEGQWDNIRR